MTALCPHCGFNLTRDGPLERGRWHLELGRALLDGVRVAITPGEAAFLYTLAKAGGALVRSEIIGLRISNAEHPQDVPKIHAFNLRKKLPEVPFEAVRKYGYRWAA